jgi:hypothetical protein
VREFKILKVILILFIILLVSQPALAKLDFEDHAFPEFVTSARALAMGNAYINKVDDSWSAFYNPAGLGTVRKPQFHLANVHLEASSGLLNAIGDGPAYELPGNYIDSFDQSKMRTALAKDQGKLAHSRFNIFPNFTLRGLTLGYFLSQRNRAIINDDVANEFEVAERRDQGPIMALNGSLFGGVFKMGVAAAYLNRKELYKAFGPTDPLTIDGVDYKKGSSLQITAGARLTLPWTLLPTVSAVMRNATNNDFEGAGSGGPPDRIKQTVDLGFSITPQISKMSRLHMEVNLKDLNNSYDTSYQRRAAAGMELDFSRRIFLRAGWGDGWGSGGIGVRSRTFILDLTTYAVDRSQDGFREEEDRRWVISFSSGF